MMENIIIQNGDTDMSKTALVKNQVTSLATPNGGLLPAPLLQKALEEFDESMMVFLSWLKAKFEPGIHYGYPKGQPLPDRDPTKWKSKPSLYKAGALSATAYFKMRAECYRDLDTWEMLGSKPGTICYKCNLFSREDGSVQGEGRGVTIVSEHQNNANTAVKMCEKRAIVDAALNTIGILSSLFTQDIEDFSQAQLEASRIIKVETRKPIDRVIDHSIDQPRFVADRTHLKQDLDRSEPVITIERDPEPASEGQLNCLTDFAHNGKLQKSWVDRIMKRIKEPMTISEAESIIKNCEREIDKRIGKDGAK